MTDVLDTKGSADVVEPELPNALAEFDDAEGFSAKPKSFGRQTLERFLRHRLAVIGLVLLVGIVVLSFVGEWWSDYEIDEVNIADRALGPSMEHPFGTDDLGRDLFVRVLAGTRLSLQIALVVAVLSTIIGGVLGALAGYFGKWVDATVAQLVNLLLVVPGIAVLAVFGKEYGSSAFALSILLAALSWIRIARIVRAQFISLKELEFVQAARASGAGPRRIIGRHMVPNIMGPVMVEITLVAATAIILEATLSFLALGVQPPDVSLGNIIDEFKGAIDSKPSRVLIPGAMLTVIAMSLNFIGDGLRDALDPRTRKVRE